MRQNLVDIHYCRFTFAKSELIKCTLAEWAMSSSVSYSHLLGLCFVSAHTYLAHITASGWPKALLCVWRCILYVKPHSLVKTVDLHAMQVQGQILSLGVCADSQPLNWLSHVTGSSSSTSAVPANAGELSLSPCAKKVSIS